MQKYCLKIKNTYTTLHTVLFLKYMEKSRTFNYKAKDFIKKYCHLSELNTQRWSGKAFSVLPVWSSSLHDHWRCGENVQTAPVRSMPWLCADAPRLTSLLGSHEDTAKWANRAGKLDSCHL